MIHTLTLLCACCRATEEVPTDKWYHVKRPANRAGWYVYLQGRGGPQRVVCPSCAPAFSAARRELRRQRKRAPRLKVNVGEKAS